MALAESTIDILKRRAGESGLALADTFKEGDTYPRLDIGTNGAPEGERVLFSAPSSAEAQAWLDGFEHGRALAPKDVGAPAGAELPPAAAEVRPRSTGRPEQADRGSRGATAAARSLVRVAPQLVRGPGGDLRQPLRRQPLPRRSRRRRGRCRDRARLTLDVDSNGAPAATARRPIFVGELYRRVTLRVDAIPRCHRGA